MRRLALVLAALAALAACTRTDRRETAADLKNAADDVKAKAHQAAQSPAVKDAGTTLRETVHDAADVTKGALRGGARGAREGADQARAAVHERRPDEHKK